MPNQKSKNHLTFLTMKKLILLITIIFISSAASAQMRFTENFDYTVGDSIGAHGWIANTGGATNRILVTSPGLTFPGYPLSGIGNAATLAATGQDQYTLLSGDDSTGSVYAFFMVKVDTAKTGDYFFALLQTGSTSFYEGRVQVRSIDGSGNIAFGITKGNASTDTAVAGIWTPHAYSRGTTYLICLKYTFVAGTNTNDQVSLFVFDSSFPSTEPAPTVGPITYSSIDASKIGRVALRQGNQSRAPYLQIDGIRVATSWFTTEINLLCAVQGLVLGNANFTDTAEVYVRSSSSPYNVIESSYKPVSITNGVLNMAGMLLSNSLAADNYYLEVRHRHSVEFRNSVNTWTANPVAIAPYNGGSYNFTSSAGQAYGSNQIDVNGTISFYNGDTNQDDIIDGGDGAEIDNDAANFEFGYLNTDLDGNEVVDGSDGAIVDNNAANFVGAVIP